MVEATLSGLTKTFDDGTVTAVDGVDLRIEAGELLVLVGPSGCGKSTTLRCIAGLESVDDGVIRFDGHDVTDLSPRERKVAMVFQNYALYPSMTVYENIGFGLKMRGVPRDEREEQIRWVAGMMDIEQLLDRYPTQLSGGQQQRVALGRAIVRDPTLFLLDEPLSNLDAKLRAVMRTELQELQRELDVTTVFVTHDQKEAMTMGDRIAVMNAGRIEQVADPHTLYHDPENLFVADFIGSPSINFLRVEAGERLSHDAFERDLPDPIAATLAAKLPESDLVLGVRPEHLDVVAPGEGTFDVTVDVIEPLGDSQIVYFGVGDKRFKLVENVTRDVREGTRVGVDVRWPETHLFDPAGPKVTKWSHEVEATAAVEARSTVGEPSNTLAGASEDEPPDPAAGSPDDVGETDQTDLTASERR